MLHLSSDYRCLLNHESAEIINCQLDERNRESAVQVAVVDDVGNRRHFIWQLSKQTDEDFADCWMTDGVMLIDAFTSAV
jgi:hypothetical protein